MLKTFVIAGTVAFTMAVPSGAQDLYIGGYAALIGPEDLTTSQGMRLMDAAAIIAQDRANYHRFGIRHSEDQSDPFFETREHRLTIPELVVMDPRTAEIIINRGAFVVVSIFGTEAGQMTEMRVEIPG